MLIASLALPAALLAFLSWSDYRTTMQHADERIDRNLDVLHEHASKVFQTGVLIMREVTALTGDLSDSEIRANEQRLHERFADMAEAIPIVQSLWLIDRDGYALVSNYIFPAPRSAPLSDRDYFAAQLPADRGLQFGQVMLPRFSKSDPFFSMSRRRAGSDGTFNGVIVVSFRPAQLEAFYADLGQERGSYFAMFRDDGALLARFPAPSDPQVLAAAQAPDLAEEFAAGGLRRIFTRRSLIDEVDRRFGYRKVTGYPVYVAAGFDMGAIRAEWLANIGRHMIVGLPLTLLLFTALLVAMRRTRRLYEEAGRREAAEAALRQSQRMEAIGQLTGGIAHDFNNLLMVISGSVERLKRRLRDAGDARTLEMIATAALRGETLTRQLLSFSRRQALAPEPVDLAQRLPELEEILHRSLRGDIGVSVTVPQGPCLVHVDLSEFEIAIINLAVNARDAMGDGGHLDLTLERVQLAGEPDGLAGPFLRISVVDTGGGIPADVLPHVFEPFFTTKDIGKGTGLGLSQVYGFARQSGGTATVSSRVGQGTSVAIYLPQRDGVPVPRAARQDLAFSAPSGAVALLVEDNLDVADVAGGYLRELGFDVEHVATAEEAIAVLQGDRAVDLVFSDILMPGGMNGLDLAHQVGRLRPATPVVLATGYSSSAKQAVAEGFPVLRKPYDARRLGVVLRDALAAAQGEPT